MNREKRAQYGVLGRADDCAHNAEGSAAKKIGSARVIRTVPHSRICIFSEEELRTLGALFPGQRGASNIMPVKRASNWDLLVCFSLSLIRPLLSALSHPHYWSWRTITVNLAWSLIDTTKGGIKNKALMPQFYS